MESRSADAINDLYGTTDNLYNDKTLFRKRNDSGGRVSGFDSPQVLNGHSARHQAKIPTTTMLVLVIGHSAAFTRMEPTNRGDHMLR